MAKKRSILAEARSWAVKKKLFGTQAFLRYVILRFAENLSQVSEDFVFKGGNLLWVYIETPRATIDLDLVTLKSNSHVKVKELIEKACLYDDEIKYRIFDFREVEQEGKSGADITITYETDQGASNRFSVDVVYAIGTDAWKIESPLGTENLIKSATIENIVTDKLTACHRFASGNTRMKDYDDLWRLSQSGIEINAVKLRKLLLKQKTDPSLQLAWISEGMERDWSSHISKYKDLPTKLHVLFIEVNQWLKSLKLDR